MSEDRFGRGDRDSRFGGNDRGGDRRSNHFRGDRNDRGDRSRGERRERNGGGTRKADVKPEILTGYFKWLDFEKGYGFITPENSSGASSASDMFAHISCLSSRLLTALRSSHASGESLSAHKVCYQIAIPEVAPGMSVGRNSGKPFAANVVLFGESTEQGLSDEEDVHAAGYAEDN